MSLAGIGCLTLLLLALLGVIFDAIESRQDSQTPTSHRNDPPAIGSGATSGDQDSGKKATEHESSTGRASSADAEHQTDQLEGWVVEAGTYTPNEWHCGYLYVSEGPDAPASQNRNANQIWLVSVSKHQRHELRREEARLVGKKVRILCAMRDLERDDDLGGAEVRRCSYGKYQVIVGEAIPKTTASRILEHKKGRLPSQPPTADEIASNLIVRAHTIVEKSYKTEVDFPWLDIPRVFNTGSNTYGVVGNYTYRNVFNTEIKAQFRVDFTLSSNSRTALSSARASALILDGQRVY